MHNASHLTNLTVDATLLQNQGILKTSNVINERENKLYETEVKIRIRVSTAWNLEKKRELKEIPKNGETVICFSSHSICWNSVLKQQFQN